MFNVKGECIVCAGNDNVSTINDGKINDLYYCQLSADYISMC